MCIRHMQKLHQQAKDALEVYRHEHRDQTDTLIAFLGQIVRDWQPYDTSDQRLAALEVLVGHQAEAILQQCDTPLGSAGHDDGPFLLLPFRRHRKACLDVLEWLGPTSTSAETTLERAMTFSLRRRGLWWSRL